METRDFVYNESIGGFGLPKGGKNLLIQKGMSKEMVRKIEFSHDLHDLHDRMNPLLVALVLEHPELFRDDTTSLNVKEVPVNAIQADAIKIQEHLGAETVVFDWEKVALWKKSNEQPKKFATLEAAIIGEAFKAEVMRLLEEFKKTIPKPMPSKPVPDKITLADSEDKE